MSGPAPQSTLPGANTPTTGISDAQTPNDILAAAKADPQLNAILAQIYTLAATPVGSLLGATISWAIARFSLPIGSEWVPIISGAGLIAGHYFQTKIWPLLLSKMK